MQLRALPLKKAETVPFRAKPLEAPETRAMRAALSRRGIKSRRTEQGHQIGYTDNPASGEIHITGSLLAQLLQGEDPAEGIRTENLRYSKIAGRGRYNLIFMIDTSGSMLSEEQLGMVKGCVISLLEDAYVRRIRAAIIAFGGGGARVVLPFTASAELAARRIDEMPGGGPTPLVEALALAARLVEETENEPCGILLLSDGHYDRTGIRSPENRIREFGSFCHKRKAGLIFVGTGPGLKTADRRERYLASLLQADYRKLQGMRAGDLASAAEESLRKGRGDVPFMGKTDKG